MRLTLIILCLVVWVNITQAQEMEPISYEGHLWGWASSSDGNYLILITADNIACRGETCERLLNMIDMREGRLLYTLDYTSYSGFDISVEGDRFAMVHLDGWVGSDAADATLTVEFRALRDGSLLFEHQLSSPEIIGDFRDTVYQLINFSDDLSLFYRQTEVLQENHFAGDVREFSLWDSESGELIFEQICEDEGIILGYAVGLLLSPDGQYLMHGCIDYTISDDLVGVMEILDIATGETLQKIPRIVQNATIGWDSNSAYILVREDDFARIHSLEEEINRIPIDGIVQLENRFSADSRYFYMESADNRSVHVMDLASATINLITAQELDAFTIEFVQSSPDGSQLLVAVTAEPYRIVKLLLLDISTGAILQQLDTEIAELTRSGFSQYPIGEVWRQDGRYVALCEGYNDSQIAARSLYVWDIESNNLITIDGP